MARILLLDTLKHPSNSGTANITLSSDETTTMPTVNINGGQIDSTSVGASSPSTVAATTLSTTGNATVGGTFGATGATTLSSTATVGGTLGVTGNTTLSGSANNVGTVTAGTLNETVVMAGVPRKTTLIRVNESAHQWNNNFYPIVVHDSISFSAIQGKHYIVEIYLGTLWIWTQYTAESPFHKVEFWKKDSAKTRGDTDSNTNPTQLGTLISHKSYNGHIRASDDENLDWANKAIRYIGSTFLCTFTASATGTEYIHMVGTNGNNEVYCQYQMSEGGGGLYYKIQEYDSYSYTTVS